MIILLQYNNSHKFCTDYVGQQESVYHILVATGHDSIEPVLVCLKDKIWNLRDHEKYPTTFKTSRCVNYKDETCQLYTSLYKSVIKQHYLTSKE